VALGLRFLSGVALGGVHMPGLKLLADRVAGRAQARGSAIYSASYSLGAAGSFLLAGVVDGAFGWRATFTASGIVPLLAIVAIALLPTAPQPAPARAIIFDFQSVLRDRALMAYVLPLLVLVQITSIADAGALASGAVAVSDPTRRGTALAAFAFIGYTAAFVGPVAVGLALDQFGGAGSAAGWAAAFATMAFGLDHSHVRDEKRPPLSATSNGVLADGRTPYSTRGISI